MIPCCTPFRFHLAFGKISLDGLEEERWEVSPETGLLRYLNCFKSKQELCGILKTDILFQNKLSWTRTHFFIRSNLIQSVLETSHQGSPALFFVPCRACCWSRGLDILYRLFICRCLIFPESHFCPTFSGLLILIHLSRLAIQSLSWA